MRKTAILAFLSITLVFTACDEEPTAAERNSQPKQAFDLAGYLDQEVKTLSGQAVTVQKTVFGEGGAEETKRFQNVNWSNELASFVEADLNKPALRGLYTETKSINAKGEPVHTYVAKDGANTNIEKAVYTFNEKGQLLAVDAIIRQDNMLFKTLKQMHLEMRPNATPRLQRYRLQETQELLFMDAEHYGVDGMLVR